MAWEVWNDRGLEYEGFTLEATIQILRAKWKEDRLDYYAEEPDLELLIETEDDIEMVLHDFKPWALWVPETVKCVS